MAFASAIDLDFRYGCTPAWWQLWKGLYQIGVDLIVTPYRGRPIDSPWWRTAPNPLYREAELYAGARSLAARLRGDRYLRSLFTAGALAVIRYAKIHGTRHRPWLTALLARRPTKVAAIALANKLARIAWAMLARSERYREPAALAA